MGFLNYPDAYDVIHGIPIQSHMNMFEATFYDYHHEIGHPETKIAQLPYPNNFLLTRVQVSGQEGKVVHLQMP